MPANTRDADRVAGRTKSGPAAMQQNKLGHHQIGLSQNPSGGIVKQFLRALDTPLEDLHGEATHIYPVQKEKWINHILRM